MGGGQQGGGEGRGQSVHGNEGLTSFPGIRPCAQHAAGTAESNSCLVCELCITGDDNTGLF